MLPHLTEKKPYWTFEEYVNNLQRVLKENPEYKDLPVVYSSDDEGNDYMTVSFEPSTCKVLDIKDRFLERICEEEPEELDGDFQTVIIIN